MLLRRRQPRVRRGQRALAGRARAARAPPLAHGAARAALQGTLSATPLLLPTGLLTHRACLNNIRRRLCWCVIKIKHVFRKCSMAYYWFHWLAYKNYMILIEIIVSRATWRWKILETWSIKIIGLEMTLVEEKAIRAGRKLISASQVICNREDKSNLFTFFFCLTVHL